MTLKGDQFDTFPPHIQAAIRRRDAVTRRIHDALASLGLTWEIAGGNLADMDRALGTWEGDKWRTIHQDVPAKHRYHRYLLRLFHNFLSSAVSAVWHAERIVGRLKHIAPDLSAEFAHRLTRLHASENYRLLRCLRHYAVHTGHHSTVLVLQGVEAEGGEMGLAGLVCFDVKVILGYLSNEAKRAGAKRRDELRDSYRIVSALPDHVEMRGILQRYFAEVGDLLRWLRRALIDLSTAVNARPLDSWVVSPDASRNEAADDQD